MTQIEALDSESKLEAEDVANINFLLEQLSQSSGAKSREDILKVVSFPQTHLIVARDMKDMGNNTGRIAGMATLVEVHTLKSFFGYVHDVVVDEKYRGQGIGQQLNEYLEQIARELNMEYLELTSRPARIAAHHLYEKLGYTKRETNVYRKELRTEQ